MSARPADLIAGADAPGGASSVTDPMAQPTTWFDTYVDTIAPPSVVPTSPSAATVPGLLTPPAPQPMASVLPALAPATTPPAPSAPFATGPLPGVAAFLPTPAIAPAASPATPTASQVQTRTQYTKTAVDWYQKRGAAVGASVKQAQATLAGAQTDQERLDAQGQLDVAQATKAHIDAKIGALQAEQNATLAFAIPETAPDAAAIRQQAVVDLDQARLVQRGTGLDQDVAVDGKAVQDAHAALVKAPDGDLSAAGQYYRANLDLKDAKVAQLDFAQPLLQKNLDAAKAGGDPAAIAQAQQQVDGAALQKQDLQLQQNAATKALDAHNLTVAAQRINGSDDRDKAMIGVYQARIEANNASMASLAFERTQLQTSLAAAQAKGDTATAGTLQTALAQVTEQNDALIDNNVAVAQYISQTSQEHAGNRGNSVLEMVMGGLEVAGGVGLGIAAGWTGIGAVGAAVAIADGAARFAHGASDTINNETTDPLVSQVAQDLGASEAWGTRIDTVAGLAGSVPSMAKYAVPGVLKMVNSESSVVKLAGIGSAATMLDLSIAQGRTLISGEGTTTFTVDGLMSAGLSQTQASWVQLAGAAVLPAAANASGRFIPNRPSLTSELAPVRAAVEAGEPLPAVFRQEGPQSVDPQAPVPFSESRWGTAPHRGDVEAHALAADSYRVASAFKGEPLTGYRLGDRVQATDQQLAKAGLTQADTYNAKSGFRSLVTFKTLPDGQHEIMVGMAGTRPLSLLKDWPTNIANGLGLPTAQYRQAIHLVKSLENAYPGQVLVTGHSLGGGLASASALAAKVPAVTFNAAGVRMSTLSRMGMELDPRLAPSVAEGGLIRAYRIRSDILTRVQGLLSPLAREGVGAPIYLDNPPGMIGRIPLVREIPMHLNGPLAQAMGEVGPYMPYSAADVPATTLPHGPGLAPTEVSRLPLENGRLQPLPDGSVLVGSDKAMMRNHAARQIASDADNPLGFLVNPETGAFYTKAELGLQKGYTHADLSDVPVYVEMGHLESAKALDGATDRVVVQGGWENQYLSQTVEAPRIGGSVVSQKSVAIGGVAVDYQTAKFWATWPVDAQWARKLGVPEGRPLLSQSVLDAAPVVE